MYLKCSLLHPYCFLCNSLFLFIYLFLFFLCWVCWYPSQSTEDKDREYTLDWWPAYCKADTHQSLTPRHLGQFTVSNWPKRACIFPNCGWKLEYHERKSTRTLEGGQANFTKKGFHSSFTFSQYVFFSLFRFHMWEWGHKVRVCSVCSSSHVLWCL